MHQRLRNLENTSKLDRHHVFPREFLKGHSTPEEINHGLNGVLLSKASNLALKKDPALYLKKILDDSQRLSEKELRDRVESHLVPYDALQSDGTPKIRYKNFIKQRATLVASEIARPDHGIRLLVFYLTDAEHGMRHVSCY